MFKRLLFISYALCFVCLDIKPTEGLQIPREYAERVRKFPLFERMLGINNWMGELLSINWKKPYAVIDWLAMFVTEEEINKTDEYNKTPLICCIRDSESFNYALFCLGASLKSYNDDNYCLLGQASLLVAEDVLCLEKPLPDDNPQLAVRGFRINGKNCILESSHPLPDFRFLAPEEKVEYWQRALQPAIWIESFQKNSSDDPQIWTIGDLKKETMQLLLACKKISAKLSSKIPKQVINNCMIPHLFSSPLNAIKTRFKRVYHELLTQIELFKTEVDYRDEMESSTSGKPYSEIMPPEQATFFSNFKTWYAKEENKKLDDPFELIKVLIRNHNRLQDYKERGIVRLPIVD